MELKKQKINRKVRIKPNLQSYSGEEGIATLVDENLKFFVTLDREVWSTSLWVDFSELEFLEDK